MRRVGVYAGAATWLVLSATAALIAGCGKSSSAPSGVASEPVTRERAVAYADAVNLREADVLGWERFEPGAEVKLTRAEIESARCEGRDPRRWLVDRHSRVFGKRGTGYMLSVVAVMPTAALAVEDTKAGLSARAFDCEAREVAPATTHLANGKLFDRGPGTLSRLASPLPGVSYSFEWRATWTHVLGPPDSFGPAVTLRSYEDLLGFVAGPAEIQLISHSTENPLPIATELQALTAIYRRAEAHKL
jgi:hypothetical protein